MMAIPSISPYDMEFLQQQHDDIMDLASSPYRQAEDLDLDLELMREPSAEPNLDSMFDDAFDEPGAPSDIMEAEPAELLHDDIMIDEETIIHQSGNVNEDPNVESGQQDSDRSGEDEDILYEDEEDSAHIVTETGKDLEQHVEETRDDSHHENADSLEDVKQIDLPQQHQQQKDDTDHQIDNTSKQPEPSEGDHKPGQKHEIVSEEATGSSTTTVFPQQSTTVTHPIQDDVKNVESDTRSQDDMAAISVKNNIQDYQRSRNLDSMAETEQVAAHNYSALLTETPTIAANDMYLHPVKVIYQESEICLFPPIEEDSSNTFFLPDASLAYENLNRLLVACRDVLAGTIGADDELVLDVASLGLHICEDSKYASQITLSQVLDVYLALSHNENIEQIEPLYCTLTSRVCLASQYAYLDVSAKEGRTFTEISTEHLGSPDESAIGYEDEITLQTSNQALLVDEAFGRYTTGQDDDLSRTQEHNIEGKTSDEQVVFDLHHEDAEEAGYDALRLDERADDEVEDLNQFQRQEKSATSTVRGDERERDGETDALFVSDNSVGTTAHLDTTKALSDDQIESPVETVSLSFGENSEPIKQADQIRVDVVQASHGQQEEELLDSASMHDETDSSHTVEGEQTDFNDFSNPDVRPESAGDEPQEQNEIRSNIDERDPPDLDNEALFDEKHAIDKAEELRRDQVGQAEPLLTEEDDLLDLEIDSEEHPEHHVGNLQVEEVEEEDLFSDEAGTPEDNEPPVKADAVINGNYVAEVKSPLTPSRGNSTKRKIAEEEDELDLLDIGTPDTKRHRPS